MPLDSCLNLIHTEYLFSRLRSLSRALNEASAAQYCALGHVAMLYSSEQTGWTLG